MYVIYTHCIGRHLYIDINITRIAYNATAYYRVLGEYGSAMGQLFLAHMAVVIRVALAAKAVVYIHFGRFGHKFLKAYHPRIIFGNKSNGIDTGIVGQKAMYVEGKNGKITLVGNHIVAPYLIIEGYKTIAYNYSHQRYKEILARQKQP
jgi:hypothetical protein